MRTIDTLLAQYRASHLNPTNEAIHFVCVPVIVFSLLGLAWAMHPVVALAVSAAAMWYYFRLSPPFAYGMLAMAVLMLALLAVMPRYTVLPVSIVVFIVAWMGHYSMKAEGQCSFFFVGYMVLRINQNM